MYKKFLAPNKLVSIFLLASVGALLVVFATMTRSLSSQVYTPVQERILLEAGKREIVQEAITTNLFAEAELAESSDNAQALAGAVANELGQLVLPVRFSRWENTVRATLDASYEEKNDVSVTVYDLDFESVYRFEIPEDSVPTTLEWIFPFPSNLETLNGVRFMVDGEEVPDAEYSPQQIRWSIPLKPGDEREVTITYRANGVSSFSYGLNQGRRTEELDVIIEVEGLTGSEIPQSALRATEIVVGESGGQMFKWQYENLVVNRDIALTLPSRLSFAQRLADLQNDFAMLSNLAPFWVVFFLLSLAILFRLEYRSFPLPAFLLMGLSFTLFYPLLTFLSGLMGVVTAALIALALIAGLLLLFIRIAVGERRVIQQVGWLLFVFLGVLSLGLLLPTRGLMLTLGGFLLVGTFMVAYAKRPSPPPPPDIPEPSPPEVESPPSEPMDYSTAPVVELQHPELESEVEPA
ncbi:MAG: hypothetical protein GY805_33325, partial [Chloroflexi bacterium]|nr:hypothetical protein [Chloroflexota bacterium]